MIILHNKKRQLIDYSNFTYLTYMQIHTIFKKNITYLPEFLRYVIVYYGKFIFNVFVWKIFENIYYETQHSTK